MLSNSSVPISTATVTLYNAGNVSIGTATTNSVGYYAFNNVAPGTYTLTETAPGYSTSVTGADIQTTVNAATAINGNTAIKVTVENLSQVTSRFGIEWSAEPYSYLWQTSSLNSVGESGPVGQFTLELSSNDGNITGSADAIYAPCTDLIDGISPPTPVNFTVQPSLTPSTATDTATTLGEIGYLYNTYGEFLQPGGAGESVNGAALQLAMWALEYNNTPNLNVNNASSLPFVVGAAPNTAQNIINAANAYLTDVAGQSEDAYFLNETSGSTQGRGSQGMMSTDFLSFTNPPVPAVATTIKDVNNNAIPINGGAAEAALGTSVHDTATVVATPGGPTPTGSVTFEFYTNATGSGTGAFAGTVPLNASGVADPSSVEGPLGAGDYSFVAIYSGDGHYAPSTSAPEPLTIDKGTLTLNTTIYNAADNSVVSGALPLGSSVYDTASFSGATAGFTPDISQVTYVFTTDPSAGNGSQSNTEGPLGAGSYKFDASFAGDANYNVALSGDEPLSISKGTVTLNTTIYNAADNSVVSGALPLGSSVYDTASFSGATAGFTPDIGQVTYVFTSRSVGWERVPVEYRRSAGCGQLQVRRFVRGRRQLQRGVERRRAVVDQQGNRDAQHDDLQRRRQFGGERGFAPGFVGVRHRQLQRGHGGLHARHQPGDLRVHDRSVGWERVPVEYRRSAGCGQLQVRRLVRGRRQLQRGAERR